MKARSRNTGANLVLVINGGSSSVKFAVFSPGKAPTRHLSGEIERIGLAKARFAYRDQAALRMNGQPIAAPDHQTAAGFLANWLDRRLGLKKIGAVGHRLVHGGNRFCTPLLITPKVLKTLRRLSPLDLDHLPAEIDLVESFLRHLPGVPQVGCFDTAFHHRMPRLARMLPLPRRLEARGVRRYGFHGLSYEYLLEELTRVAGRKTARGRLILAHLGNGASLAAVRNGRSQDTSMGFTPAAGLPMSTRTGDLDPGLVWYLARVEKMTPRQFNDMVNKKSGLLGISETSSDMRDLLAREATDARAAEAIALFCYQVRKWIGAYAAALGGLDTLVFAGGIGENAPVIRRRICAALDFLGIELDNVKNRQNLDLISTARSRVAVRVIRTDEEVVIARAASPFLANKLRR